MIFRQPKKTSPRNLNLRGLIFFQQNAFLHDVAITTDTHIIKKTFFLQA